ncbi:MAG: DUF1573 domain-containing protein [Microscillaceae bacterium]|nr:DUF1573 domain-containing protein [Microscillaceae bacterium]
MSAFWACNSDSKTENTESTEPSGIVATSTNSADEAKDASKDKDTSPENGEDANKEFAKMDFKENLFDFGTVKEGKVVEHTFEFTNTGSVPLVIKEATASCGCTVPQWPKEPIAPGEKNVIQVQFNSQGKPGNINKTVTIQANTYPPITTLQIKGTVTQVMDMNGPLNK